MNKLHTSTLLVILFASNSAFSHVAIGVFDLERALFSTEAWGEVEQQLEAEISSDQAAADTLVEELRELQVQLERDGATMTANDIQRIQEEGQIKQMRLEQIGVRVQEIVQTRRASFLEMYRESLSNAINEVFNEGEYDIILDSDSVVISGFTLDITSEVIAKLNEVEL